LFLTLYSVSGEILYASKSLLTGEDVNVVMDSAQGLVYIIYSGPTSAWHGIGFGASEMSGTYAVIIDGDGSYQERKLGNHQEGTELTSSILYSNSVTSGSTITTNLTRNMTGLSSSYYTFSTSKTSVSIIYSLGSSSSFNGQQHKSESTGTLSFSSTTSAPTSKPTASTSSPTTSHSPTKSPTPKPTSNSSMATTTTATVTTTTFTTTSSVTTTASNGIKITNNIYTCFVYCLAILFMLLA